MGIELVQACTRIKQIQKSCPPSTVPIAEPDTAAAQVWTVQAKVRPVGLVRWRFPLADPL